MVNSSKIKTKQNYVLQNYKQNKLSIPKEKEQVQSKKKISDQSKTRNPADKYQTLWLTSSIWCLW